MSALDRVYEIEKGRPAYLNRIIGILLTIVVIVMLLVVLGIGLQRVLSFLLGAGGAWLDDLALLVGVALLVVWADRRFRISR